MTSPTTPSGRVNDHLGIPGLILFRDFFNPGEQQEALVRIDAEPWRGDLKRRVQHYGYRYDYTSRSVDRTMRIGELPPFAQVIGQRLLDFGLVAELPDQMIVNEYQPGQGISAHVDCEPCFKDGIVTISLGWVYEMDFISFVTKEVRSTLLELGSAVVMTGESRYHWQHRIQARKSDHRVPRGRRVSLTFRNVILTATDAEFREAMNYTLEKNAELYRRLAKS
jgi:alkylated DNA repair dioxygenase AlkB